jgi:hypothetical protein
MAVNCDAPRHLLTLLLIVAPPPIDGISCNALHFICKGKTGSNWNDT